MIDLTELNNHIVTEIVLDDTYSFNEEYLEDSEIEALNDVKVKGIISKNSNDDNIIDLKITGKMILTDAISLELVSYPFSIELKEEVLEINQNNQNSLDIMELLWQNIVLEVPLRFTEVTDFEGYQGDGWKLVSEKELKVSNNPFNDLKKMLGEE